MSDVIMATSINSDGNEDAAKTQETRGESSHRLLQVMTVYGREFCFLLAVIFTAFAAFQNGPLKTRKANPPQRFFPLSSLVSDFYVGNMQGLNSLLLENDVSIVMYYAPWDAVCIQARSEFETAARYYHAQVFFAAVNCWWPEGECRRSLKLQSYPLLLAHVRRAGSVTYNGPLLATYLIPFLDHVLSPVFPIYQQGELLDLQAQHEAVMVGYFEFHSSPQPPGYRQYYIAALKMLGKDTTRRLGFAVVTSRAAAVRLRVTVESVVLHLWNGTKVYPEPVIKNENLISWAYNNLNQVCTWLSPSGIKSRLMAQVLEKSPTLILFTPRNLMLGPPPYYDLLRETAMNYFNCENSPGVTSVIHRIILKRHIRQKDFNKLRDICSPRYIDMTSAEQPFASACCQSFSLPKFKVRKKSESTCYCSACIYTANGWPVSSGDSSCREGLKAASVSRRLSKGRCDNRKFTVKIKGRSLYFASVKCLSRQSEFSKLTLSLAVGTSKASGVEDDKILKMSLTKKKQECRHLNLALKYSPFNFPLAPAHPSNSYWQANFSGLGCRTNRSLSFLALDTVLHHSFAEHLGVDIYSMPHQTAAVIVEAKQESQYLLPDVTKHTLVDFIKNFTLGRLDRYLRSVSSLYPNSPLDDLTGALCVLEATTETFSDIVLNPTKDVVLMYYAPWCVFCSGIAHIYLTVAKFFSDVEGITFARINGDLNDLPWEFTVEKYPTILFFPAHKKSESVEFPSSLPINNVNLIQFVLANAKSNVRWQAAMQLCDGDCHTQNALQSSLQVQDLFLELRTLRNQLHHLEDYLFGLAKDESLKTNELPPGPFDKEIPQWKSLNEFRNHLVEILKNKKRKIRQARELQKFLRKRLRTGSMSTEMELLHKELATTKGILPKTPINKITPIKSFSKEYKETLYKNTPEMPLIAVSEEKKVFKKSKPASATSKTYSLKEPSLATKTETKSIVPEKISTSGGKVVPEKEKSVISPLKYQPSLTTKSESGSIGKPKIGSKLAGEPVDYKKPSKIKIGISKNKEKSEPLLKKKRRTDEL